MKGTERKTRQEYCAIITWIIVICGGILALGLRGPEDQFEIAHEGIIKHIDFIGDNSNRTAIYWTDGQINLVIGFHEDIILGGNYVLYKRIGSDIHRIITTELAGQLEFIGRR